MKEYIMAKDYLIANSQGLSSDDVADLATLARARIEVFSALHHVHFRQSLIDSGRVLQDSFFYLPLMGRLELDFDGQSREVGPGELIFLTAGQPHGAHNLSLRFEVAAVHAHIHLGNGLPDQQLFGESVHRLNHGGYWQEQMTFITALPQGPAFARTAGDIIRQLLMGLVRQGARLLPQRGAVDQRIQAAISLMQNHLGAPLPLEEIGRQVGLGSSQFRLLFRRELGTSPKDFQKNLRLEAALRHVRRRDLSIKQVAARLGYASPQHLVKHFKAAFGMPPGRYRETL